MSREIKFRAWLKSRWEDDVDAEKMYYDVQNSYDNLGNVKPYDPMISFDDWFLDDVAIVEQYTGLKDKNGTEIYEGDIVKIVSEPFLEPDIGIVGFNESRGLYDTYTIENNRIYWTTGSCFCSLMSRKDFTTEVIGNIHENPELLEN